VAATALSVAGIEVYCFGHRHSSRLGRRNARARTRRAAAPRVARTRSNQFDAKSGHQPATRAIRRRRCACRAHHHLYAMNHVVSADGGRYSDGKLVWWNVGKGGFLASAGDHRSSASTQLAANGHEDPKASSGGRKRSRGDSRTGSVYRYPRRRRIEHFCDAQVGNRPR
jgi:hypothetical protein